MNTNQTTLTLYSNKFTVTNSSELVGGTQKTWKEMITQLSQTIEQPYIQTGSQDMSSLDYDVTHLNRMDCPLQLNPHTATFNDIAIHALLRQRLNPSTIEKHLRYARFMETHSIPVDFRNPSFQNFLKHMDYREQIEQATPNALIHQWKAMQTFLKAYGIPFGEGTGWNGHEESATTHIYVNQATDYYNHLPADWISLALKPSQMAGQRGQEKIDRTHFLALLTGIPPRTQNGPVEI
jgi:hypothetical protein